jgi:hypothetical protein
VKTYRRVAAGVVAVALAGAPLAIANSGAQAASQRNGIRAETQTAPVRGDGQWRKNAKVTLSDVLNASLSLESYFSSFQDYPMSKKQALSSANPDKFVASRGSQLTIRTDGYFGFCIFGTGHLSIYTDATPLIYDSQNGGLQGKGTPLPYGGKCSSNYKYGYTLP